MKNLSKLWATAVLAVPLLLAGCTATSSDSSLPAQSQGLAQVQIQQPTSSPAPSNAVDSEDVVFVPDLAGLPVDEAEPVLNKMGFKLKWSKKMSDRSSWVISDSTPGKGKELPRGATLTLSVEKATAAAGAADTGNSAAPAAPTSSVPSRSTSTTGSSGSSTASAGRSSVGGGAAVAPSTSGVGVYYANCTEVRSAGKAPIHADDPGYAPKLDRDGDGVGCE